MTEVKIFSIYSQFLGEFTANFKDTYSLYLVVINLMNYGEVITLTHSMHAYAAFDYVNTTSALFHAIFAMYF